MFHHIPKTGGTWLENLIEAHAPASWEVQRIIGHRLTVPSTHRRRPTIACVRNPWEWHVSRFCFWQQHFVNKTGGYALPHEQWTPQETEWAVALNYIGVQPCISFHNWVRYNLLNFPSLSELVADLPTDTHFFDFSELRNSNAIFANIDMTGCDELLDALANSPPVNASERPADYRSMYYGWSTVHAVADREKRVLDTFGYTFAEL